MFPDNLKLRVGSIQTYGVMTKNACAGDDIGLNLKSYYRYYRTKMMGKVLSEIGADQCRMAQSFIAQIIIMSAPY